MATQYTSLDVFSFFCDKLKYTHFAAAADMTIQTKAERSSVDIELTNKTKQNKTDAHQ